MTNIVGTWNVNANGHNGVLQLNLNSNGILQQGSTILGDRIVGSYDAVTGMLSFTRVTRNNQNDPSAHQVYTGYKFRDSDHEHIAGFFIAQINAGGTVNRTHFGWFASRDGDDSNP